MSMKLGFNCAGTEKVFEEMLNEATSGIDAPNYLEVGVAEGTTLSSVSNFLRVRPRWNVLGVDLLDGPYFNPVKWMKGNMELVTAVCHFPVQVKCDLTNQHCVTQVHLSDGGLRDIQFENTRFNFALIDGCHGAPCVESDFNHIEPLMARGGIIAFHDALPEDQDRDFQPHCQMPISVRKALGNLGLLQGSRPGWEFVTEVAGDKTREGNGFMFFRRI